MRNELLFRLTAGLRCRLIRPGGKSYLERYYLGQWWGVTFYLHRFVSSDSEEHVHNHPWRYGGALILAGSYVEEYPVDICPTAGPAGCITEWRKRRWFNIVNGNTFHRLHDAKPGTWTLFVHGKRVEVTPGVFKGWGFLERVLLADPHQEVTVFTPYVPTGDGDELEWWKTAQLGRDIGREPLE